MIRTCWVNQGMPESSYSLLVDGLACLISSVKVPRKRYELYEQGLSRRIHSNTVTKYFQLDVILGVLGRSSYVLSATFWWVSWCGIYVTGTKLMVPRIISWGWPAWSSFVLIIGCGRKPPLASPWLGCSSAHFWDAIQSHLSACSFTRVLVDDCQK